MPADNGKDMIHRMLRLKMFQRYLAVLLLVGLILPATTMAAKTAAKPQGVSAKSAILSDATKVKRLYGKNVHGKVLPASTVKVMTAILVMEKLSLDDTITVSHRATLPPPSKIYLKQGEKFKVRDLLWAILLGSANDASVALAEAVAGSESKFVALMNSRAKQLGAKNTKFANASGLPTPKVAQYSSAYDMYVIFLHALKFPFFRQAIEYRHKTIYSAAGRKVYLKNHNKILFNKEFKRKIYGKTGYTRAAKACFVGTVKKDGRTLVVAVFGCTRRWDDIRHIVSRYGGVSL